MILLHGVPFQLVWMLVFTCSFGGYIVGATAGLLFARFFHKGVGALFAGGLLGVLAVACYFTFYYFWSMIGGLSSQLIWSFVVFPSFAALAVGLVLTPLVAKPLL